jgi:KDO2-lipid IV(A) lauroyltransferase
MADDFATRAEVDWPVESQSVEGLEDGPWLRVECLLLRAAVGVAVRLPERWLDLLLGGLARLARRMDRSHTEAARVFLRQALGELPPEELEARVLQAYRHVFWVLVDGERLRARVPRERLAERYDIRWTDEARALAASGGSCIMVSAHVGAWEAALPIPGLMGLGPLYLIGRPPKSKPVARWVQPRREALGVRLLPRSGGMRLARSVIAGGGSIGMLLDQRARKNPVLAPFFGRPARCDRSAGVLLKRLRVPVLVVACYRGPEPLTYRVEFPAVLRPEDFEGADPTAIAGRLNEVFERMILAHPEQYFWLHDRYRKTPRTFEEAASLPPEGGIRPMEPTEQRSEPESADKRA